MPNATMWPFSKKTQPSNVDPYWDYIDPLQYMSGPRFAQFTQGEGDAVRRAFAAFQGQKLHPEIAEDTFGAFAAAALATHALDTIRGYPEEPQVFSYAISALEHASSLYGHPALVSYRGDVLEAAGQLQAAQEMRAEASRQATRWIAKDTDRILLSMIRS